MTCTTTLHTPIWAKKGFTTSVWEQLFRTSGLFVSFCVFLVWERVHVVVFCKHRNDVRRSHKNVRGKLVWFKSTCWPAMCWVPRVHRVQARLCAWSANRQDCGKICDGYQVPMSYIGKKIERMTGRISEWLVKSVIGPKWLCHLIDIALSFHW